MSADGSPGGAAAAGSRADGSGGAGALAALLAAVATMARLACGGFALILVTYVLFAVGRASPSAWPVALVANWANGLDLGLTGIVRTENIDYQAIADYGAPALGWLLLGSFIGWALRHLGPTR